MGITVEELQLAARNHALPLEILREPITPAGLHYLLIHFDIPAVDPGAYRLTIDGLVERPMSLSLADLQSRPAVTLPVTLECAGNGRALLEPRWQSQPWLTEAVGTAVWTGTPLRPLLEEAGLSPSAVEVVFTGIDRGVQGDIEHDYARSLSLEDALRDEVLVAYAMNGAPLPPQHGYPVRLIVPGWYGMTHVKWLRSITVVDSPFLGWQQDYAYKLRQSDDDVDAAAVTRMLPRSLMVPPGVPVFFGRARVLSAGPCELVGRAWSGWAPIVRVEVSTDGGSTWLDAELDSDAPEYAWRGWRVVWDAPVGEHVLMCRATDGAGNTQPLEADWNLEGYCNNGVQRVNVTVS
jgi:sulfane dehydrogenase subunit SoxC